MKVFEGSKFMKSVLRTITMIAYWNPLPYIATDFWDLSLIPRRRLSRSCQIPVPGLAPVAGEDLLQQYEYVFDDQWRSRKNPEPVLYSPLYDGREGWDADPYPHVKAEYFRLLLEMMRNVVCLWQKRAANHQRTLLDEENLLEVLSCQILAMPSADVLNILCSNDYIYEACRLTSVLMIWSVQEEQSWRAMGQKTNITTRIRGILERTVRGELWDRKTGLLYWVTMILACASFGTPDYMFAHCVLLRIQWELIYCHDDWHGALKPMMVLKNLMAMCGEVSMWESLRSFQWFWGSQWTGALRGSLNLAEDGKVFLKHRDSQSPKSQELIISSRNKTWS